MFCIRVWIQIRNYRPWIEIHAAFILCRILDDEYGLLMIEWRVGGFTQSCQILAKRPGYTTLREVSINSMVTTPRVYAIKSDHWNEVPRTVFANVEFFNPR